MYTSNQLRMSLVKIELYHSDFLTFYRFLAKSEPERIISVSGYHVHNLYVSEETTLIPANDSTTVIIFRVNGRDIDVTVECCTREATTYATEITKEVYIECHEDELDDYRQVCQEISFYKGKAKPENNEILIQEATIKDSIASFTRPVQVLPLDKLGITTGVAQECIRYIDSCIDSNGKLKGNKCNLLIYGEYGTGKLSLVKALALHYKKPLVVITTRADMPISLIRDNVINGSILCLRDSDITGGLMVELFESHQFKLKNLIVVMIAYDPKNMPVAFFSPGRIGHIAKLEPLKKQEIKQYIEKRIPNITEETLKSCMNHFSNLTKERGGGVGIAAISSYIDRFGGEDGTGLILEENIKQVVHQAELRKEILQLNSDKMYS